MLERIRRYGRRSRLLHRCSLLLPPNGKRDEDQVALNVRHTKSCNDHFDPSSPVRHFSHNRDLPVTASLCKRIRMYEYCPVPSYTDNEP